MRTKVITLTYQFQSKKATTHVVFDAMTRVETL